MSELKESLSALMDDQAEELEIHRVLKATDQDPEARDTWHRYQLASQAMRKEAPGQMMDLSESISRAIDNEPAYKRAPSRWLKPVANVAIAASVAVVSVLGVQYLNQQETGVEPIASDSVVSAPDYLPSQLSAPVGFSEPRLATQRVSLNTPAGSAPVNRVILLDTGLPKIDYERQLQMQKFLDEMMKRHIQGAAHASAMGPFPYARTPREQQPK